MLNSRHWTRLVIVVSLVAICWIASYAIEDAGKNPYRSWQKQSDNPRAAPPLPEWDDDWQNIFPTKEGKSLR